MTPKQELQLLEEIEALNKTYIFFTHSENKMGYFNNGKGDEVAKNNLEHEIRNGKRFFNVDEVENLLPNVIIVNFIDFSEDNEVKFNTEALKMSEKPINILNLGKGKNPNKL